MATKNVEKFNGNFLLPLPAALCEETAAACERVAAEESLTFGNTPLVGAAAIKKKEGIRMLFGSGLSYLSSKYHGEQTFGLSEQFSPAEKAML